MESPSPISGNCMSLCNNNLFSNKYDRLSIDTVDSVNKLNTVNISKHPGQAVKIITEVSGEHKVVKEGKDQKNEVRKRNEMKSSKSCTNFDALGKSSTGIKNSQSNSSLKDCKSCDENLIKFIFTKHGIQVISDVETIV